MKKTNILFVCKYNRFRSKVAEAYFKKINKNKMIKVSSAGLIKGSPLSKRQINSAKKFGINIKGKRRGLSTKLLKKQDLVIIVADDVPQDIFKSTEFSFKKGKKTINWKIRDKTSSIGLIMKKVDKLNKMLEKEK